MSAVSTPESAKARQSLPGSTSYSPGPELLLLRMAAEVLRTPHKVFVTSLIFMHRFKARSVSFEADTCEALRASPYRLVCACLFVAAKVNEVILSASDLINVVRCLLRPETWKEAAAAIPALEAHNDGLGILDCGHLGAGALSGDAYYATKSTLLHDEQTLLRVLRFEVAVELPHPVLLNLCRSLDCPRDLAQTALCLLNDMLTQTDVPAEASSALMAGAALHLAGMLRGLPASHRGSRMQTVSWWVGLNLRLEQLEEVCHKLLDVMNSQSWSAEPVAPTRRKNNTDDTTVSQSL